MAKDPIKVQEVESEDWELAVYPKPDQQFPSNQKYMTYESITTGAGGKK